MMTRLYVGNLPLDLDEEGLRALFAVHGEVLSVILMTETASGRSRGFGFVQMPAAAAEVAMEALDGLSLREQDPDAGLLRVNVARDRGAKPPRRTY